MSHLFVSLLVLLVTLSFTFSYKMIGYYPNWVQYGTKSCQYFPESVNATLWTHINYAFAYVNGSTYELYPTEWNDQSTSSMEGLYARVQDLKKKNSALKVLLSVGGASFNEDSKTKHIFSTMAASASTRQQFVKNSLAYLSKWKFDGIDLDWEFPGQTSSGGTSADKNNFSLLMQEFRTEITNNYGGKFLLTIASSADKETWTAAYDLPTVAKYVDWINIMTYDFHGPWDGVTDPQTAMDSTSDHYTVKYAISGYLAAGVPASKIVLGLALYGHSYTISSTSTCPGFNTPSSGAAPAGSCSQESGTLNYNEIVASVLSQSSTIKKFESVSETPYACYGSLVTRGIESNEDDEENVEESNSVNHWLSYDNEQSLKYKTDYVKSQGLGGAMFWSLGADNHDELSRYVYAQLH